MKERKLLMLPGPTNVPNRVIQRMTQPIIDHRGDDFHKLYDDIKENLKYVFQTESDVFVLTSSGTGGLECAVSNIINPGDKAIVPVFGAFSERLKGHVTVRGGKPIEIQVDWGDAPTAEQIEAVIRKEKNAKAIIIVHNETSTGAIVRELPKIGEIARENNLLLVVDAISSLGGDYLPVDKWNIDLCVTGSQKCLACPPGLAMVSISERAWKIVEKTVAKPFYFDLVRFRDFDEKKETPSTPALSLFYALHEALKIIREEGLEKRFKRHKICAQAFYEGLETLGLTAYPKPHLRSNTVIAVNVPANVDSKQVREIMEKRYNIVVAKGRGKIRHKILRIGCMGAISEAEVLATVDAFEKALRDVGYPVEVGAGIEVARKVFHP
ncbi:MAG: alanine--glyoxylate aminotransferase family protein [Thermoproteota archaeon]|nr:alanine--glyoxylate aminotransferase family protein [Thermoproteota archaeon]